MTAFPALDRRRGARPLEADYRRLLSDEMFPAVRRLAAFARNDFLPKARTYGRVRRAARRREDVSLRGARQHHHRSVARRNPRARPARSEARPGAFLAAAAKAGFQRQREPGARLGCEGKRDTYPFTSSEQVIEYLNAINARIVPQLPKLFGRLPKARLEIRLTDPAIAASTPAQYYSPTDDGRPGIFAMPVTNRGSVSTCRSRRAARARRHARPPSRDRAQAREQGAANSAAVWGSPRSVRAGGSTPSRSATSSGLYGDPLELMGRYSFELCRAGRLVVDTGLHAKGWTREQAIRYFVDECGQSRGRRDQ